MICLNLFVLKFWLINGGKVIDKVSIIRFVIDLIWFFILNVVMVLGLCLVINVVMIVIVIGVNIFVLVVGKLIFRIFWIEFNGVCELVCKFNNLFLIVRI